MWDRVGGLSWRDVSRMIFTSVVFTYNDTVFDVNQAFGMLQCAHNVYDNRKTLLLLYRILPLRFNLHTEREKYRRRKPRQRRGVETNRKIFNSRNWTMNLAKKFRLRRVTSAIHWRDRDLWILNIKNYPTL